MNYNTYSESDMESETNFQQPTGRNSNNNINNSSNNNNNSNNFVRNNSIKNSNKQQHKQQQQQKSSNVQRRASDCSYYGGLGDTGDNISYYGVPLSGHKRSSLNGTNGMRRSHSNKSSLSSSSSNVSSRSSTCSGDETTSTSSGQPNLPYPGFVEYSFRYLDQESRPRNWCLQLITNP